ncbi:TlpA family protein disulfide reductase [Effusibacillus dendaii]|uniref:Thioredoxin domain-containing protein n=1 Tax=Effusibacillus dendaii TaxID=2743772 RepID=A0A7I8D977_9BACL|nr:TlpA disulfide reductase family protein [Effusibacillus dendaii]BCJ86698.1 hypothetical protein skT53_16830 [Effusibacillus dendaii]
MKNWKLLFSIVLVVGLVVFTVFSQTTKGKSTAGQTPESKMQPSAGQQSNSQQSAQQPTQQQSAGQPNTSQPAVSPQPGKMAPDFALRDMAGQTVRLSDLRGKPVLINFWASWCGPCRQEMPDLVKKSETYKDQITFVGINLTSSESDAKDVQSFLQEFHVKYPILLDEEGQVSNLYQVLGIPTTVSINPDGMIVDRITGAMNADQMEKVMQNLLKK